MTSRVGWTWNGSTASRSVAGAYRALWPPDYAGSRAAQGMAGDQRIPSSAPALCAASAGLSARARSSWPSQRQSDRTLVRCGRVMARQPCRPSFRPMEHLRQADRPRVPRPTNRPRMDVTISWAPPSKRTSSPTASTGTGTPRRRTTAAFLACRTAALIGGLPTPGQAVRTVAALRIDLLPNVRRNQIVDLSAVLPRSPGCVVTRSLPLESSRPSRAWGHPTVFSPPGTRRVPRTSEAGRCCAKPWPSADESDVLDAEGIARRHGRSPRCPWAKRGPAPRRSSSTFSNWVRSERSHRMHGSVLSWPENGATLSKTRAGAQARIGLVGSGHNARGLSIAVHRSPDFVVSRVLTRRNLASFPNPFGLTLTNSCDELIRNSDIAVVTTGDAIYGTDITAQILDSGLPVVTMDAELQVTAGSYLSSRGYLVEAQGDQPGSIWALAGEAQAMGLDPIVYGNIKGFINLEPSLDEMVYWANKYGITLTQVVAFTDGTKLQIEQALVANGLGATIAQRGLVGPRTQDLRSGALVLAGVADRLRAPISDYVLPDSGNPGVFVVVRTDDDSLAYLDYYKVRLPDSPYVLLERPFHLCCFEIPITLRRTLRGAPDIFNNGARPTVSVAAIAKRHLDPGYKIARGIGSFDIRGEAVPILGSLDHVPIGLLAQSTVERPIEKGQIVTWSDVTIPESLARKAWEWTVGVAGKPSNRGKVYGPSPQPVVLRSPEVLVLDGWTDRTPLHPSDDVVPSAGPQKIDTQSGPPPT